MSGDQNQSVSSGASRRLIQATGATGIAAAGAAALLGGLRTEDPGAVLLLAGIVMLSVLIPVRYTHPAGDVQGFNFTNAIVVALLFVAPAGLAVTAAAAAVAAGFLVLSAPPRKIWFNAGQTALSAAAAAAVFHLLPTSSDVLSVGSVAGALAALLAADLISAGLMAELFHRLDGRTQTAVVTDSRRLLGIALLSNAVAAIMLAALAVEAPAATVVAMLLLIGTLEAVLRFLPVGGGFAPSQFGRP